MSFGDLTKAIQLEGIRKWAVIFSISLSGFVVIWSCMKGQDVPDGVSGILASMNGFTISLYGLTKTAERISNDIKQSKGENK
jgi:hypothetical protein